MQLLLGFPGIDITLCDHQGHSAANWLTSGKAMKRALDQLPLESDSDGAAKRLREEDDEQESSSDEDAGDDS